MIADLGSAIFRLKTCEFEVPVLRKTEEMLVPRQVRQFVLEPEKMKPAARSLLEKIKCNSHDVIGEG